jgi:cobalt-zinc-cadmium efflux system protein
VVILVVELAGGIAANSLALVADAGHVLADVVGMSLALGAVWIGSRPASRERTFGYLRLEILAAVVNAVLLFGVAAFILFEAWRRLSEPAVVSSGLMLAVAVMGMVLNLVALWLLHPVHLQSLTMRAAYLEVFGDVAGSAGVIAAALFVGATGIAAADTLVSVAIALLILPRTWHLLRDAIDVLLEATPKGVAMDQVRAHILDVPGVVDVHDLHAWTITSGVPVLSAHVIVDHAWHQRGRSGEVLDRLGECLGGHFDVSRCTFQLEPVGHQEHEAAHHA